MLKTWSSTSINTWPRNGKQETHGKIPITPGEVWLPAVKIKEEIMKAMAFLLAFIF